MHRTALAWAWPALLIHLLLVLSPVAAQTTASPETAKPADSFVSSIGVNVKLDYADTPYGDFNRLEAVLKRSGIRHVRDGLAADPEIQRRMLKLHADGINSTAIVQGAILVPGPGLQTAFDARLAILAPALDMIEGPNEADAGYDYDGKRFPDSLTEYQHLLYGAVKHSSYAAIPVIAPSISYPPNSAKVPDEPGDFGNTHSYHGGRNPGTAENNLDLPKFYLSNSALVSPGKPVICTETGNPTAAYPDASLWMPRVSEWAQGKYTVRTYLEYFNAGIKRTFIHELIDEHPDPHHDEQNFGLLRNDWSPKPAFTGTANMIAILQDPGPAFSSKPLAFTLTGATADIHHLLLQKRDGTFYLALWKEVSGYDPVKFQDIGVADSAVRLHVSPAAFEGAYTYEPMASPAPAALLLSGDGGNIDLSIGDEPMIVQLLPAGADLIVTSAKAAGGPVQAGQPVTLQAVITNRGTAPTPAGLLLAVTFFDASTVTPQMLTYGAQVQDSLAPGQSVLLTSDHPWTPAAAGHYSLTALVDDAKRIPETNRTNDTLAFGVDVK